MVGHRGRFERRVGVIVITWCAGARPGRGCRLHDGRTAVSGLSSSGDCTSRNAISRGGTAVTEAHVKPTTTDAGTPVESDEHSLTVGPDGPILLQDHYLIEQMANFNRERIPERQPHAKGGGAFGHFEVTQRRRRLHQGRGIPAGYRTDTLIQVLHRGRGAGQPRHLAGPARLRAEVLHLRGQLRHGREQHAGLLHSRPAEVPALHPLAEAAAPTTTCATTTCSGTSGRCSRSRRTR